MDDFFNSVWGFSPLVLLVVGYVAGHRFEQAHLKSIRRREAETSDLLVSPVSNLPGVPMSEPILVTGSAVVSIDYFKRFAAALRGLFGGPVMSLETVVDRGRREAILRMKAQAIAAGLDAVVGMRIETSRLASARSDGKGTAGIEVVAYGTAVCLAQTGSSSVPTSGLPLP